MKLEIEITEKELRDMIYNYLSEKLGSIPFKNDDVKIEVKSKQNYKSEWEQAEFRARLSYVKLL